MRQLNRLAKSTGAFWSKPTFVIFSIFLFYNYVVPFSSSLAGLNVPSSHVAARGFLEGYLCVLFLGIGGFDTAENEPFLSLLSLAMIT